MDILGYLKNNKHRKYWVIIDCILIVLMFGILTYAEFNKSFNVSIFVYICLVSTQFSLLFFCIGILRERKLKR